jgi:hypothetical protein
MAIGMVVKYCIIPNKIREYDLQLLATSAIDIALIFSTLIIMDG